MVFKRMELEEWFDRYQYEIDHDIGESGVKFLKFGDLELDLSDLPLRYGHHRGAPELRELIASDYPGLSPDQIVVTTGASEANFALVASLVGPDDHIIVEHPNYPSLYEVPASLNRNLTLFPLSFDEQFKPNLDKLKRLMTPQTRLVTLTHPNNPTGSTISAKELEEVIRLVESHDAYLLMDETYRELSFEDPPPRAATLSPRAISITTMSKVYRVPGIRIGWVAADESIIESVRAVREQITICNSVVGERIAFKILQRKEELLAQTKELVKTNYQIVEGWLDGRSDVEWIPPRGGVVAFPRLAEDVPADDLCRLLVEKYRTFVVPGYCFQMDRHFRLGFGGAPEELKAGLGCLDKTLEEWRGSLR